MRLIASVANGCSPGPCAGLEITLSDLLFHDGSRDVTGSWYSQCSCQRRVSRTLVCKVLEIIFLRGKKKVPRRFQLSWFSWRVKHPQKLMAVLNWHPGSLKYSKPLLPSYPWEIAFSLIWLGFIITKTNRQTLARGRGTSPLSWGKEGKRRDCNFAIASGLKNKNEPHCFCSGAFPVVKSRYIRSLPRVLFQLNSVSKVPINFWEIELNSVSSWNLLPKHDIGFAVLGTETAFGVL